MNTSTFKKWMTFASGTAFVLAGWALFAQPQSKPAPPKPKDGAAAAPEIKPANRKDPKPQNEKEVQKTGEPVVQSQAGTAAGSAKADPKEDADRQLISQKAAAFVKAYNAHDASAVAELFALKAEFTDEDGKLIKGREAIQADFAQLFTESPKSVIEIEISSIRVLTPNIAIEEGTVRGLPSPDAESNVSQYVVIHVKVDGDWQIGSVTDYRNDSDDLLPNDRLQELGWMVGEWIDENANAVVRATCRWDDSGSYLLLDFVAQAAGVVSANGSMRIGWDPLTRQTKSWTFDADGGYAEGLWVRVENEWHVKSRGVNSRGEATTATSVYRLIDNDTMSWRSFDRFAGMRSTEDLAENIIKRRSPSPTVD